VWTDTHLSTELAAIQLSQAEIPPEHTLRVRHVLP
jgi:hypothetical protein